MSERVKIEKKKRYFFSGAEVARGKISYPKLSEYVEIENFYRELAENAFEWFCDSFCKHVGEEYRREFDNKSRGAFRRYDYVLEIDVKSENVHEILIEYNVTLGRKGEEYIFNFSECDKWDKKEQMIVRSSQRKTP